MNLEISPPPSLAERGAIAAALTRLLRDPEFGRGAWWEAGVRENLDAEEGEERPVA